MKCKRCGADEDRINGYCSAYCEDIAELEADLAEMTADRDSEQRWAGQYHADWVRERNRAEKLAAEVERLKEEIKLITAPAAEGGGALQWWKNRTEKAEADRALALKAVKHAYLKHCLNSDHIGWEELDQLLLDTLCNILGDDGYQEWLNWHRMVD